MPRLAALRSCAKITTTDLPGVSSDAETIGKHVVPCRIDVQLNVTCGTAKSVNSDIVNCSFLSPKGHYAGFVVIGNASVVRRYHHRQLINLTAGVNSQDRVESASIGGNGNIHVRRRDPTPPHGAARNVSGQMRGFADFPGRSKVISGITARDGRNDDGIRKIVIRRCGITRPHKVDENPG